MDAHQCNFAWTLENLETRQLLSAGVPAIATLLDASAVVAQPMIKNANLVGTWKVTSVQIRRTHVTKTGTMTITKQTRGGALTGTGTSGNALSGTIKGNSFTLTAADSDGTTTAITGTVSDDGNKLSGTWVDAQNRDSGTFTATRS